MEKCDDKTHWWERTPPRPYDPAGYTAPDAKCQCGRFRYDQEKELLFGTPSVGVGTFVSDLSIYDDRHDAWGTARLWYDAR